MIIAYTIKKKGATVETLHHKDVTDKYLNDLKKGAVAWLDVYFPKKTHEEQYRFNRETAIVEKFLKLKPKTILELLRKPYRPTAMTRGDVTIIILPYFSAIRHVTPLHAEKFVPLESDTSHFIILFKKPNLIVSVRTDPKSFSMECVSIVISWVQQAELSQTLLDEVIVRLMDEIIDDNVEMIRRFRMNVEFLEQDIIRKSIRSGVIDEVLKLKSISMYLASYVLAEKRLYTRIHSSGIPGLVMSENVRNIVTTTIGEIDSQTGIINDINRSLTDILNIYSLMLQDRLNHVLRIFTIFNVLFILPTFITSFFGMNAFAPYLIDPFFLFFSLVIIISVIVVPLIILWKSKLLKQIRL
ncbi:MAG: CorA family divalent cation transporter [Candidatus Helarchaeales archaeon]